MATWISAGAATFLFLALLFLARKWLSTRSALASKTPRTPLNRRETSGGEDGETKLASDPPQPTGSAHVQSLSTEIEISDPAFTIESDFDDQPTGPTPRILVTAFGQTDAGRRRKHNEDAFVMLEQHSLFVIADGMGGYAAGEVASQLAVDVIRNAFASKNFGGTPIAGLPRRGDELVRAIQSANSMILNQARSNEAQSGMGTTLVAIRFSPNRARAYLAHVGDSRIYRLRGQELKQLTTDHTLGAMGISGPSASKLSRAVGVFDEVEVDLTVDVPESGDHYILCSDGLSKMVPEPAIAELIRTAENIDVAVKRLIEEANNRGGKDNVSVILIRVDDPTM